MVRPLWLPFNAWTQQRQCADIDLLYRYDLYGYGLYSYGLLEPGEGEEEEAQFKQGRY